MNYIKAIYWWWLKSVLHTVKIIKKNSFLSCINVRLMFIPTLKEKIGVFPLLILHFPHDFMVWKRKMMTMQNLKIMNTHY